jgi:CYTH domain-containing protein
MERERKFLVTEKPPRLSRFKCAKIEQGYLSLDNGQPGHFEVRLRCTDGSKYTLTIKKKKQTPTRLEKEIKLTPAAAKKLWPLTAGRRVVKTRYDIPYRGHTIELDVYRGKTRGLVTAEVEFSSLAAMRKFKPPQWMKKEVTGRSKYANARLAVFGWKNGKRPRK